MSIYTVTAEVEAVHDQVNNRINLEFHDANLAEYWLARIHATVSSFNNGDTVVATFIGEDNLGQSVTWDHDTEWTTANFTRPANGSVIVVSNNGTEIRTTGLTHPFVFTQLRLASGSQTQLPVTRATFTAVTRVTVDTDANTLRFADERNSGGFTAAINNLAHRFDRTLAYTFRLQDQSSNAAVTLFPGFQLNSPGLPIATRVSETVSLNIDEAVMPLNGLVSGVARNLTNMRVFDENGDELYLSVPRFDPFDVSGVSRMSRPRSRRQTVADRRGDTSWAGNTSMRNPQAKPLTRIPYVNPFRDGDE